MIRRLSAPELRQARSITRTIFPGAGPADLDGFFAETLAAVPLALALAFRAAVAAAAVSPLLVLGRPALFAALPELQRVRVLEAFARSDLYFARSAFNLLKATAARACAGACR